MDERLWYTAFESAPGWVGVLASAKGLLRLTLPQSSAQEARNQLGGKAKQAIRSPRQFSELASRLKTYFNGGNVVFPDELDLRGATAFQRLVWEATRRIPFGETRSYRWVAEQIGRPGGARAVGQALGRNPLPVIIPCHRVLGSNGQLGGFTGGLEMKRMLLRLEGASSPAQPEK